MENVLTATNLCKSYGRFNALNGLTATVPQGAVYGLVGKNGSGKTTLFRLICGLAYPTAGTFTLYDVKNTSGEITRARRRMGAMVETPALYGELSAYDNLMQQARVLGLPSFNVVDETLKTVGLSDTGKKKVKNFSLGMKQRLGIGIALIGDPDFLMLDEPANGLDPQGIIDMRELIIKLNRENRITVLISSHILDELYRLATHYGFIDDGRIIKEISAEELERVLNKKTHIEVTDIKTLARVLDELELSYEIISNSGAYIYGDVPVTGLVTALSEQNCIVISVNQTEESLESYYLRLLGGGRNA